MPLSAQPIGGKDALNKRIPKNPKYEKVKSVVNSGFSARKLEERFDNRMSNIRFRRNENFRRIKSSELEEIVRTVALDILLLDLRDEDEFIESHIQGAKNYPARMLSRAMHPFTPEILDYSNREPERIIVIYDLDERIVLNAGNLFFEKGIDNVFVLSGGMKKLAKDAPWFIEGKGQVTEGTSSPSKDSAISLGSSCPSSALSYQTRPPRRAPALDGPLTHNRGTAQPWK